MKNTLSDRLNYLTTIAEEQSITRAATRLFISQPALTAFLSRTEEELGTRLFDRTSTPIRITEAGAYYLSELEKICVMQDRLHQELADFSADDQELRLNVGIGRNRGSIWLSSVMPELYRLYPDMLLTIFEDRDTNMLDKVLNGVLDVAIVETYAYHSDLHYLRLPSEQYMFITSSENPRITLSWLFILHSIISALPFSLSAESQISQQITERSCLLRSLVDRDFSPDAQAVPGQNVPQRGWCRSTDDAAPAPCVR